METKSAKQTKFHSLQEQIFDYFKNYDNKTIINFIHSFCFYQPAKENNTPQLIDKFLKDNELTEVYLLYVMEDKNPPEFFFKQKVSEKRIIEDIKVALLVLAYNRFSQCE